jgi:23S rRNA G2445 N2-methylase RlmL
MAGVYGWSIRSNFAVREVNYLARSIRGLEWILAAEISVRIGGSITEVVHRAVHFKAPLTNSVLNLGSADDVFFEVARIRGVPHTRDALALLAGEVKRVPWREALNVVRMHRAFQQRGTFEVIASFLGGRNYSRREIEQTIGGAFSEITGMPFLDHERSGPPADASWRVHIRNGEAIVAIRLGPTALHRRTYKQNSRPGTLHPPVAYAMAILADIQPGIRVTDPCCGAGTILVEAHRLEPNALIVGSDLKPDAIAAAAANLRRSGLHPPLLVAEAGRLPYGDGSFDRIISNVPWGGAVQAAGTLRNAPERLGEELARTLDHGGRAVLLTSENEVALPHLTAFTFMIRLFGRRANITIFTGEEQSRKLFNPQSTFGLALMESFPLYIQP